MGQWTKARIQLCGRFVADIDGSRIEDTLPGRLGRVMFAYLVLNRARPPGQHAGDRRRAALPGRHLPAPHPPRHDRLPHMAARTGADPQQSAKRWPTEGPAMQRDTADVIVAIDQKALPRRRADGHPSGS